MNADNEYTVITGFIPVYDDNGNMISDGQKDYIYDWANRLIEVRESGQIVMKYTYDALNRRVSESDILSTTRTHIYNGSEVIEEYVNGILDKVHTYGAGTDNLLMTKTQGQKYYYSKNKKQSITAITDSVGNLVERYKYSAYGLMKIFNAQGQEITTTGSTIGNRYGSPADVGMLKQAFGIIEVGCTLRY